MKHMIAKHNTKLPIKMRTRRKEAAVHTGRPHTTITENDPATWTVLVIEDDADNLDLVRRVLTYHQATVYVARNGEGGLKILDNVTPTFILLDLSMPGMDGWTVIRQIRSRPETARLPVIALTAHAMNGTREQVLAGGFDGYISKPFQVTDFLNQIRGCVKNVSRSN